MVLCYSSFSKLIQEEKLFLIVNIKEKIELENHHYIIIIIIIDSGKNH